MLTELLALRERAITLQHSIFTREAESLLDLKYPGWREHLRPEEPPIIKFRSQPEVPPRGPTDYDYIKEANERDPWLDRR